MPRPTEDEVEEQITAIITMKEQGERTRYPVLTYEDGVRDALEWMNDESDEPPIEII